MKYAPQLIENVVRKMCARISESKGVSTLNRWDEEKYIYELVSCLLSSRVPFATAVGFASHLRHAGLLVPGKWYARSGVIDDEIRGALSGLIKLDARDVRYRFPELRARQLSATRSSLRRAGGLEALMSEPDVKQLRAQLVATVHGFGPKQASMFLRNTGKSDDLAILDSHVMRYAQYIGLFPRAQSLSDRNYERLESQFHRYAQQIGYTVSCVDSAVWITMRAATRES